MSHGDEESEKAEVVELFFTCDKGSLSLTINKNAGSFITDAVVPRYFCFIRELAELPSREETRKILEAVDMLNKNISSLQDGPVAERQTQRT